ncbi:MAG TPA: CHAD domain-containing protein [Pyrinomonadaceae bacterium]|nr:CHAD domain-containing protein [Pyrinomonadaceae bacterium]
MKGKRIAGVDCSAPAEEMIRHVLRTQVAAMCAVRKKALNWSDPEGVHDMRVLSRRLRSAIADFEPYLHKTRLPPAKLRAIARSLGDVRDEDVALAALEKLKIETHGAVTLGFETLIDERRTRRDKARADLQKAIRRSAIAELIEEFESRLAPPDFSPEESGFPTAVVTQPTFRSVGVRVINSRLKEFRAAGTHIFFPAENKELHELRILAKGLRYAIELLAVCWGEEMRLIAKEVALLQTSLGELHDCDVWIAELGARLKRVARHDPTDPEHVRINAACTWLLRHFARVRTEHYRDALGRWQQWQADGFLNGLRALIGST